MKHLKKHRYNF